MNAEELIAKVKALAEEGVAGEKENAKVLLEKLCRKHNIKLSEIDDSSILKFDVNFGSKYEKRLLNQVFYSVVGDIDENKGFYTYIHRHRKGCLECTKAEFIEIQAKFNFYKYHLEKDMKLFYDAFVQRNNIYPPDEKCKPREEKTHFFLTDDELKILSMCKGLEKHNYNLQIENKEA